MRLEGFLSERLSAIFFKHNSKKIKIFPSTIIDNYLDINEERRKKIICLKKIVFDMIIYLK